jgi:hypothetical protein
LDKLRLDADRNCYTHRAASGRRQRRRTRHGIAPIPSHRLTITRLLHVSRAAVAGRIVWHRCSQYQGDSAAMSCALRIILVSTLLQEFILVPSSLQLTNSLCPSWIVSEPLTTEKTRRQRGICPVGPQYMCQQRLVLLHADSCLHQLPTGPKLAEGSQLVNLSPSLPIGIHCVISLIPQGRNHRRSFVSQWEVHQRHQSDQVGETSCSSCRHGPVST